MTRMLTEVGLATGRAWLLRRVRAAAASGKTIYLLPRSRAGRRRGQAPPPGVEVVFVRLMRTEAAAR